MIDRQQFDGSTPAIGFTATDVVPAARTEGLNIEAVGDELVIFECENFHYHSLNPAAATVFRLCDGLRTIGQISALTQTTRYALDEDAVALAVAELGEAGLLQQPAETFDSRWHRRKFLKVAGVGLVGGFGIPVVTSITAPSAEAAGSLGATCSSHTECDSGCCGYPGSCATPGAKANGARCLDDCECATQTCCLVTGNTHKTCKPIGTC